MKIDRISCAELGYMQTRNRYRVYDAVIAAFEDSGISRETLARRLGLTEYAARELLAGADDWTIDTVSDLLYAINQQEMVYTTGARVELPVSFGIPTKIRRELGRPATMQNIGWMIAASLGVSVAVVAISIGALIYLL